MATQCACEYPAKFFFFFFFFWMQKQASTGAGFFPYFVLKVVKKVAYLPGSIFHAVAWRCWEDVLQSCISIIPEIKCRKELHTMSASLKPSLPPVLKQSILPGQLCRYCCKSSTFTFGRIGPMASKRFSNAFQSFSQLARLPSNNPSYRLHCLLWALTCRFSVFCLGTVLGIVWNLVPMAYDIRKPRCYGWNLNRRIAYQMKRKQSQFNSPTTFALRVITNALNRR